MTLTDAFLSQAGSCTALGSPFMGRLLTSLADVWPTETALGQLCASWNGDIGPGGASLPLRIAGGLHALVLTERDPDLATVYPPANPTDAELTKQVLAALERNQDFMIDWMQNAPQTNEVRRSAALIPAAHWIAVRHDLPFMVSELGASAGLNLIWDKFALQTAGGRLGPDDAALVLEPDWAGPLPAQAEITVAERRGVDLNPLNAKAPDQGLRLFSYLWPDQPHRMQLTRAAIAAQDAIVDQGDAIDWLEGRLAQQPQGQVHLIYHTIAWQYFPTESQKRGTALIETAGTQATPDRPLAWLRMEADEITGGAGLTVRLWPGDQTVTLGRVDFHGRWVQWDAP
ncbi:DUF2332 domain-containing protein [Falsiphaeobacter marinintestinus]|uniref:DUF2332 domain-containing protein n=1 Tax=Falsiphaeobacter marinintestinus TaxID=1492905 RepID=UPI0011B473A3|nr:DUF2332 family protein [Phaeobacter marinintestinus]